MSARFESIAEIAAQITLFALLGLFVTVGCAALTRAEKTASTDLATVQADYAKGVKGAETFCADVAKAETAGLLTGKLAADTDKFCAGVAKAAAAGVSATAATPAGSAVVSVPPVNAAGAPAVGRAPAQ